MGIGGRYQRMPVYIYDLSYKLFNYPNFFFTLVTAIYAN